MSDAEQAMLALMRANEEQRLLIVELMAERDAADKELERERMRLAACGVVAVSDTPESAARERDMHPDYRSASCNDVARRVDECMALRAEVERLRELVRSGYTEGWQDARAAEGDPDETSSDAWDMSAARAALGPKP